VFSYGDENVSDILGIIGVSTSLVISDIPFDGPISAVKVGRSEGKYIINPSLDESPLCDMELTVAGTDNAVVMVEGGGEEVSEEAILEAINRAHEEIKKINSLQRELREEKVRSHVIDGIKEAVKIPDKLRRQVELDRILDEAKGQINPDGDDSISKNISGIFHDVEKDLVRKMILDEGVRADGRKPADIRQISSTVGLLPRVHGSALFVRGETQALAATTLGTTDDEQRIDALEGEYYKTFMLHYNFPPFSVGEVRFLRGPGRREIGHGALAERALVPIMPSKEDFPYTIRIVSDILESNGSSSMATVCGATLSLMDAGVPIKKPVAGIAMGLIIDGDRSEVLTDILGLEDHLGDMDFKVTGTEQGITAFQMDVKVAGISSEVMHTALERAREGRLYILDKMKDTMGAHRDNLSPHAPRIYTMKIKPDKIRDVIGTGGKVIRGIIEQTGAKINVDDDGTVSIASSDEAAAKEAITIIEGIVEEAVLGKVYKGEVKRITDFGAFVEIIPGTDGLLHISQIAHRRLEKVTEELKEGDIIEVKVIEMDKTGRIRLSRKELLKKDSDSHKKSEKPAEKV
jgi:polyribonucleotide nucleotidyltransferase